MPAIAWARITSWSPNISSPAPRSSSRSSCWSMSCGSLCRSGRRQPSDPAQRMMKFLTDFGDSAVLLPLSAVVLIWLLATRSVGAAIWWVGVLVVFGAVIGGLKMLFFACPPAVDVRSPSGHTGFSMLVYGGIAAIIAIQCRSVIARIAIMLAATALVIGIAICRVTLRMHSRNE